MDIALLNTRITIQKNTVVTDKVGNHKNAWEDYYSCAATVSSESGSEVNRTSETLEQQVVAFTIRYSSEVKNLTSTAFRVIFQDELYDITTIDHMNLKRKSLKLWCQKVRR